MNVDQLSDNLFELSRYCTKDDESILMDASVKLKMLNEENQALRHQLKSVCNALMEVRK
jgi:hypothetical protein